MTKLEFEFIGWCCDETINADKVWGIIKLSEDDDLSVGNYVSFWGRRGKKLQTKMHVDAYQWDMLKLAYQKQDKGYQPVDETKLNEVYPEFQKDLEKTAFWSQFKI
jgi:predicted DNA-binding WGR domain protein